LIFGHYLSQKTSFSKYFLNFALQSVNTTELDWWRELLRKSLKKCQKKLKLSYI